MTRAIDPRRIEVVDDAMAAVLRAKTPAERFKMADDAHRTARVLIAAGVRQIHPDWDEADVQMEVSRRLLGEHCLSAALAGQGRGNSS
jgi:hypothetical protein